MKLGAVGLRSYEPMTAARSRLPQARLHRRHGGFGQRPRRRRQTAARRRARRPRRDCAPRPVRDARAAHDPYVRIRRSAPLPSEPPSSTTMTSSGGGDRRASASRHCTNATPPAMHRHYDGYGRQGRLGGTVSQQVAFLPAGSAPMCVAEPGRLTSWLETARRHDATTEHARDRGSRTATKHVAPFSVRRDEWLKRRYAVCVPSDTALRALSRVSTAVAAAGRCRTSPCRRWP